MWTGVAAWAISMSDGTGDLHSSLTIFFNRGTTRNPLAQILEQKYVAHTREL